MLGAIAGDMIGSRFERWNIKKKDFPLFTEDCCFTDDSVVTLAVADALLRCGGDYTRLSGYAVESMQTIGRCYPYCGYGGNFLRWLFSPEPVPYNSFGNGAAMRVSPCGIVARSLEEAKRLARAVTGVSHNHPEGMKGAEATAVAVYLARTGSSREEIGACMEQYYDLDFTLDEIRSDYMFDVSCQGSVPQAIRAFLESVDFEDAIRNAISIGGDSDTIAAIAGGIAGAYYGVPTAIEYEVKSRLDKRLLMVVQKFEETFGVGFGK